MSTIAAPLTAAQFEALQLPPDKRHELVRGEVVELPMAYLPHEKIKANINRMMVRFDPDAKIGQLFPEAMCQLSSNDLRVPDLSFYLNGQIPAGGGSVYLPVPALAIEVVSSESAAASMAKVKDYFRAGCRMVWQVYPDARTVVVHEADGTGRMFDPPQVIEVLWLPGLRIAIAEVFQGLD